MDVENKVLWTKQEVIDRIYLLSRKYYAGYVDKNPNAAIYMFQGKLQEMVASGADSILI